jgi:signal peptidase I
MRRGLDRHCRDPHKLRPMPRRAAFVRTRSRGRRVAASVRSLLVLVVAALLLRSLVVAPFSIPSESMLPLLRIGDVLLVTKWPYGWSRYSFPLAPPFLSGRLFGRAPARGDVVVFRNPAYPRTTYIKRVIGLPGDTIAMRRGAPILNGRTVPQIRVADLLVPVNAQHPCREENGLAVRREPQPDGTVACRYPRLRETLPGGRAYDVIDLGHVAAADDMAAVRVPAGRYFLLGDNRDRSLDSRFAPAAGGIGTVPAEYLIGRAWLLFFSHDGTADPLRPWTWWRAMQGDRTAAAL